MIRLAMQYFLAQHSDPDKMLQHLQALHVHIEIKCLFRSAKKKKKKTLPMVSVLLEVLYCRNQAMHFFWLNEVGASSIPLVLDRFTVLLLLVFERFPNIELTSSPRSIFLLVLLLLLRGITLA